MAEGVNGEVWLAYMQFHHSRDADQLRANITEVPKDFSRYSVPTGGNQIWAQITGGRWGDAMAVTTAGRDLYRTAVAVDGAGRAWVFWWNDGGNFDILARAVDGAGAGDQLSIWIERRGTPVATTDAMGRVWVAWQGWRAGLAAIYVANQEGREFSRPQKISNSEKNEWDPAIAADKIGRVAVAWDSYRHGNSNISLHALILPRRLG